jgi:Ca-dependent carbohydrate-binding module xylan-binding
MAITPPAPAAAVGYDTETLGPSVTLGSNWRPFNFYAANPSGVSATQNADGSVTIAGGGDTYNAQLSTASMISNGTANGQWQGEAFGGGLYAQATISFSGPSDGLYGSASDQWPAFWANTIEGMSTGGPNVETDFMEMDSAGTPDQYGTALHNFTPGAPEQSTGSWVNLSAGTNLNQPNTYGFLWVPATATTQGYADWFFNGLQVGQTVTWSQGSPGPYGVLDGNHLALILGTGSNSPMTVSSVQVWQASSADDILNGTTPPTPSPNGTRITSASAAPIIDQSGNSWSLVQSATRGLQIAVNGVVDAITSNVVLLETLNGAIVQENTSNNWYSETTPNDSWAQIANPNPPPLATVTGSGSDTLVLSISEDAYANGDGTSDSNGDAAFTVSVDGKQLAGTFYASASHSAGVSQNFTFMGNWAPGTHTVTVDFLNDAYAGTPSTDRNLYVNDVTYDGTDTKQSAALMSTGSKTFSVTDSTAIPPVVTGGGSDSLSVKVSEDYYLANAQFTVSVNGKQLGGTFTVTTLHSSGNSQTFAFAGDFGSGQHTVSVDFLNDAWAGTPATDRNLYVNDIVYNGIDTGQSAPLYTNGVKTFSISGGTTPSVSETGDHGSLQENLSQTGTYTVGGDTFVLGSGNAATVTLGTGASQIKFVGPNSVTLTGGAGQATVTADAGNNKFVAGAGSLDVTGGAGKDAYVFHTTSGLLTLEDFSLAKGDTLTIDKSLQGSLHEASDGIGGTMLTFGANMGHGVDIHGLAALPSSNIVWA